MIGMTVTAHGHNGLNHWRKGHFNGVRVHQVSDDGKEWHDAPGDEGVSDKGHVRRTELAMQSARRVQPEPVAAPHVTSRPQEMGVNLHVQSKRSWLNALLWAATASAWTAAALVAAHQMGWW